MSILRNRIGMQKNKCLFPHYKVEEQPIKRPKKIFQNGKSEDESAEAIVNEKLYHNWYVSPKTQSHQDLRRKHLR